MAEAKPKFDPNKSFESAGSEKPAFNSAKPFEVPGSEPSLGQNLVGGAINVGRGVDSVSGAPTRSAIYSAIDLKNPVAAFGHQFLRKPEEAPTGEDIVNKIGEKAPFLNTGGKQNLYPSDPMDRKLGLSLPKDQPLTTNAAVLGKGVDFVADPTIALSFGANVLAKGIGKAWKGVNEGLFSVKLAKNAEEVKAASKVLGTEATAGQLLDSSTVKKLEDVQSKSQGFAGRGLRKTIEKNQEQTQKAAEALTKERSAKSETASGVEFKDKFKDELQKKLEPAEQIYGAWEGAMKETKLPISKDGMMNRFSELKQEHQYSDKALGLIQNFESKFSTVNSLDDLKNLRTSVGKAINPKAMDSNELSAISSIYHDLTGVRSDSLKEMIKSSQTKEFAEEAIKQIGEADNIWRESSESVGNALLNKGSKSKLGPKGTSDKFFKENPEIASINKVLKTQDPTKIAKVQKDFPEAFEVLRKNKIEEIFKSAEYNGKLNNSKLVKSIDSMPPETQVVIFGEDGKKKAQALKVWIEALPLTTNPSGTAQMMQFIEMLNPKTQALAAGRQMVYNALTKPALGEDVFSKIGASGLGNNLGKGAYAVSKAPQNRNKKGLSIPGKTGLTMPVGE